LCSTNEALNTTHFMACKASPVVFGIVDLVSKKWIASLLSAEESSTQTQVLFLDALVAEGLIDEVEARQGCVDVDDEAIPILLAISDNGSPMTSDKTRTFMALCSIAQHFGRPSTPTDQAWTETLWGHVKGEWPHLDTITDPADPAVELERVRTAYNGTSLHESIGYVTPNDEHTGRGPAIRNARILGLAAAAQARKDHHRNTPTTSPETSPNAD
jgi:putative transposase